MRFIFGQTLLWIMRKGRFKGAAQGIPYKAVVPATSRQAGFGEIAGLASGAGAAPLLGHREYRWPARLFS
jgi:hypothetical protein